MLNLVTIMAKATNVSVVELEALILRGVKPTKALYRLGVEQQLAGVIGTLKIASTEEEINAVYANEQVKSCMTNHPVGRFYSLIGLSVLYNDRYRVLVSLSTGWKSERGYGVLCFKLDEVLDNSGIFNSDPYSIPQTENVKVAFTLDISRSIISRSVSIACDIFIPFLDSIEIDKEFGLTHTMFEVIRSLKEDVHFLAPIDYDTLCNVLPFYEEKEAEEKYERMYSSYFNLPSRDTLVCLGKDVHGATVYLEQKGDSFYHYYTPEGFYKRSDWLCNHTIEVDNEGQPVVNVFDDLPF